MDLWNSALDNLPKDADKNARQKVTERLSELIDTVKTTMNLTVEGEVFSMKSEGKNTLILTIGLEELDRKGRYLDTKWSSLAVEEEDYLEKLREKEEAGRKRKR